MKLSTVAALFAFTSAVLADFDMYHGDFYFSDFRGGVATRDVWQVYQADPDCKTVLDHTPITDSSYDVSGNKLGVRCVGSGCNGNNNPADIELVEMHFSNNPLYHWTIYRDRGHYEMIGLDGRVYGQCDPFPSNSYSCRFGTTLITGYRKFRCYTQFTAAQINQGRSNRRRSPNRLTEKSDIDSVDSVTVEKRDETN